ncbi:MAG: hydroxymethylglutaryl-CoA reductase, degradative [Myxococcota bacterium]
MAQLLDVGPDTLAALDPDTLELTLADKLIENVVGVLGVPVGLGLNLVVNGDDILVPLAVEEPSVVAAFSNAAKLVRKGGGFTADADPSHMIAQLQMSPPSALDADKAMQGLMDAQAEIDAEAAQAAESMARRGGGFVRSELRRVEDPEGPPLVVVHLIIDVLDAMGANAVNHVAETIAPRVAAAAGCPVNLRILSNLSDLRRARASCRVPIDALQPGVAERIADADRFARLDPYRAATHNKGIFNGIDAFALATGNDWRAIEAGAHAWAARSGQYRGLTRWEIQGDRLVGRIELPMAVGTVGGITRSHPTIALLRTLVRAPSARTLAGIFAAVGLAQNLAALRALASDGIQRGHMRLHARQLALAAGASPAEVDAVVQATVNRGRVSADGVAEALRTVRATSDPHQPEDQ